VIVDHHTIAAIALSGTALNLLGGLYLAYDLFGAKHGPLRTLTRAVTYGVVFFLGYVVFLPVGFSALFGWRFGVSFGVLTTVGQIVAYRMGFSPTLGLDARRQWRKHFLGVANRTIGYAVAGLVSAVMAQKEGRTTLVFGVGVGVAIGAVSAVVGVIAPNIEHWADRLPARRLGVFGTFLIFSGFLLESFERWLVLFDVPIR